MTTLPEKTIPPFANNLRVVREKQAMMSRAQLMQRCQKLASEDETKYVKVGMTTLHDLEVGSRRPRPSTAATLAAALDVPVTELFPAGFDDPNRNPSGRVDDGTNWPRPGRPKKQS